MNDRHKVKKNFTISYKNEFWELPNNMNTWVIYFPPSYTTLFPLIGNAMFQDFYLIFILKAVEIASPDVIK